MADLETIQRRVELLEGYLVALSEIRYYNQRLVLRLVEVLERKISSKEINSMAEIDDLKAQITRGEQSLSGVMGALSDQAQAIAAELNQVAQGGAGGNGPAITEAANRVSGLADALDQVKTQLEASTAALKADDVIPPA